MPLVHFPKIFHSRSMVKRLHRTPGHVSAWSGNGTCLLYTSKIQDPANLGAIIRTAEALGVDGAVLSGCCDLYNPKVLRSPCRVGIEGNNAVEGARPVQGEGGAVSYTHLREWKILGKWTRGIFSHSSSISTVRFS